MDITTVGILVGAMHLNPGVDGPPKWTPGMYVQTSNDYVGAIYQNCQGRTSIMAGRPLGHSKLGLCRVIKGSSRSMLA
jgi:hypothetical protein